MEDWRQKLKREAREMEAAVRAALALTSDEAVRVELERLTATPNFGNFTWLWAPALAKRNRVMFRPFILSSFDRASTNGEGTMFDAWKGETAAPLEALLAEVDAADDIELTKRLYTWRLESRAQGDAWWHEDLLRRFRAATTPSARHIALAKVDPGTWRSIDPTTAVELWTLDRTASRKFILSHLPWRSDIAQWKKLLDISRDSDAEFHFELYRKLVDAKTWREDVLALPKLPDISKELQRRHPGAHGLDAAPVFYALLEKHGDAAIAYVKRQAGTIGPRWSWSASKEGKGLPELVELAASRNWLDLWGTLLRTSASRDLYDAEVKKLVRAGDRTRLELLGGRGREMHFPGWSYVQTHTLADDTAVGLYAKYPALVRGPFRVNVTPLWSESFPKLAASAIAAGDHDLVDYLASRVAANQYGDNSRAKAIEVLKAHYQKLPDAELVVHAATALSRMQPFGIWNEKIWLDGNDLAALFFRRSTERFLGDAAAVRDLLESPQIYVQLLAFRILGQDDARARAIAAEHVDLLQATLFNKLRPASRRLAFVALRNAGRNDEATARYLLGRMRDALSLPEKRYPVEELVGLIGDVLSRWPALRTAREQPVVYRPARAEWATR